MLSKLKFRGFHATILSTYDIFTLYTTSPHIILVKGNLLDLIVWIFKRALKSAVHFICPITAARSFSLSLTKVDIHFAHVRMHAMPYEKVQK